MNSISDYLLERTSKARPRRALLVLEDGTVFAGTAAGAPGEVFGEICFNTSLEGYLEIVTDPSYAGQIVVLTYPQVGNYGVHPDDVQAQVPALSGLVVRDLCAAPSSWRSRESLGSYLAREGVVAIKGVDTRAHGYRPVLLRPHGRHDGAGRRPRHAALGRARRRCLLRGEALRALGRRHRGAYGGGGGHGARLPQDPRRAAGL